MRRARKKFLIRIILLGAIIVSLILLIDTKEDSLGTSPRELYTRAQNLQVHGVKDATCALKPEVYVCGGYCPWSNLKDGKLVNCSFLPRIPHVDFIYYNIYCNPPPDHCPDYNVWLKDTLPSTDVLISRVPANLTSNFTLQFTISLHYGIREFRDNRMIHLNWTNKQIEQYQHRLRDRELYGTYVTEDFSPVLQKYASIGINNKDCAVIGSQKPWIEAALLEYKARSVTTIESATIHSNISRLRTITPQAFFEEQQRQGENRQLFDSVWSYSNIEHDGLGRYHDPLNPYGDLQTMVKITCILKPGGFLFLAVPLNTRDRLQFNLHRLYGPIRLPLLYRYFHIVEILGEEMARIPSIYHIHPFVVLQNKVGCQ